MVKIRQEKIDRIVDNIPLQKLDSGKEKGELLVLGWGSTYGSIKTAVHDVVQAGHEVSHAQLRYLNPFPKNLGEILGNFERVLIPEMNNGQLIKIIRDKYFVDAIGFNKIKGMPFTTGELTRKIIETLQ
jgi:2-oxoglutarate ferredoxin oxidoreductase subunit alpha